MGLCSVKTWRTVQAIPEFDGVRVADYALERGKMAAEAVRPGVVQVLPLEHTHPKSINLSGHVLTNGGDIQA